MLEHPLKAGIVTPYGLFNYGNRLQSYAVQILLSHYNISAEEVIYPEINKQSGLKQSLKPLVYGRFNRSLKAKRYRSFKEFDSKIAKRFFKDEKDIEAASYDYAIIGSDQIWNPNSIKPMEAVFGKFVDPRKRICISPSFGIESLEKKWEGVYSGGLQDLGFLSVREKAGQRIIEKLTGRNAELLVDPTFALTDEQWAKQARYDYVPDDKYIFAYFLSSDAARYLNEVSDIAAKGTCRIVNIMDSKNGYYGAGPQDFIALISNASLICTDSFHAAVFSLIFSRPFKVFSRLGPKSMNSRIETLSSIFGIEKSSNDNELLNVSEQLLSDLECKTTILKEAARLRNYLDGIFSTK